MASPLSRNERLLLFKFRDALKKAGIVFEGRSVKLSGDHASIEFDDVLTDSDNTPYELYVSAHQGKPPPEAWTTTSKNRLVST